MLCISLVLFVFGLCLLACEILVFRPGTESRPTALKGRSPNHWTARELPSLVFNYCSTQLSWKVQCSPVSHNDMKETPVRKPIFLFLRTVALLRVTEQVNSGAEPVRIWWLHALMR